MQVAFQTVVLDPTMAQQDVHGIRQGWYMLTPNSLTVDADGIKLWWVATWDPNAGDPDPQQNSAKQPAPVAYLLDVDVAEAFDTTSNFVGVVKVNGVYKALLITGDV